MYYLYCSIKVNSGCCCGGGGRILKVNVYINVSKSTKRLFPGLKCKDVNDTLLKRSSFSHGLAFNATIHICHKGRKEKTNKLAAVNNRSKDRPKLKNVFFSKNGTKTILTMADRQPAAEMIDLLS